MPALLCKSGEGIRGGDAFFHISGQSGVGMLTGWGNATALIEPRGNPPSAAAQRLFALRRNLRLLEATPQKAGGFSAWHQADIADAETRLRDQAVFLISFMAA